MILSAAIKINGKVYDGASHQEAISKAQNDGQNIAGVNRWRDGLFRVKDGRLITRAQAQQEYGISQSEEVPNLNQSSHNAPNFKQQHQIPVPKIVEKHEWRQRGPELVCVSCQSPHAHHIGINRRFMGYDGDGNIIVKIIK
jgi:hypothetical protein